MSEHTPERSSTASVTERLKAEADRVRDEVGAVRTEISAAIDERRGGSSKTVDEAAGKLAELRTGLQTDLEALLARAPEREELVARGAPIAGGVAAGAAALAGSVVGLKRRGARRKRQRDLTEQAQAVAAAIRGLDTDEDRETSSGRGRLLALVFVVGAAAAAAFVARQTGRSTPDPLADPWSRDADPTG